VDSLLGYGRRGGRRDGRNAPAETAGLSSPKRCERITMAVGARTILRLVAVIAALVAGAVYWNFGTLSPCGVIREVIRQRNDMADIIPDGVIDFGFETQFGEMSANRCFAVLLENLTSPVPTTEQASQSLSMHPPARRQGKQRSSPSVRRLPPFAL
jgi:hypothetical protein